MKRRFKVKCIVGKKYLTRNGCIATCVNPDGLFQVKTKQRKWAGCLRWWPRDLPTDPRQRRDFFPASRQKQNGGWFYDADGRFLGGSWECPLDIVKEIK